MIANTQEEVNKICDFIENMENNFIIDEKNSEGRKARQKTSEFGYRSYHYIVQTHADEILGVKIPKDVIGHRKAEIQVRTLLQHAWANVSHDQFYKSQFKKPEYLERSMARLSALLEEADESFSSVIDGLNTYKLNYGAYMGESKITEELETLKTILANEPAKKNEPAIALKIAKLAKAACKWKIVIDELKPYVEPPGKEQNEILCEYGHALCRLYKGQPDESSLYKEGQKLLENIAIKENETIYVPALMHLAWSYRDVTGKEQQARKYYRQAYEKDPLNPYVLAAYLEYEIYCGKDSSFLPLMRNALENAIKTCRSHIEAGIELPWAYLAMGRFNLFLGDFAESLASYAKAIHLCSDKDACTKEDIFDEELEFFKRISIGKEPPPEYKWAEDLLFLGKSVIFHKDKVLKEVKERAVRKKPFQTPIVIVAGGTDARYEKEMQKYKETLLKVFSGFKGTIISGGTTAGIPGIVGFLRDKLHQKGEKHFTAIGYLPDSMPKDVKVDKRYDEIIYTEGRDFSPRQPLQNWIDLIAAGVKPSDIMVFGINGGKIAALEYRLALALGATVGVIQSSGRAVKDLIPDANWWDAQNLLWLPYDVMSIRAFVNPGEPLIERPTQEQLAEMIHTEFLKEDRYKSVDPVMKPWDALRDDLKESNIQQVAYMSEILKAAGYGVRKVKGEPNMPDFSKEEIEIMAEMEHGRWNVERLKSGWKYGAKKDAEKKISPYLVEWDALTDEVKGYDRENVNNWPKILASVGLEIYRLPEEVNRPIVEGKSRTKTRKKEKK